MRIRESRARTADRVRDRGHRTVLADDTLVQVLFEPHQLRHLAFHQPRDGDTRPLGDDLGDVFLVDLFLQHGAVALHVFETRRERIDFALQHRDVPVAQLRGALEVAVTLGSLRFELRLLEARVRLLHRDDGVLLGLPVRDHAVALLLQRREVGFERLQPAARRVVGLLRQSRALDLELADAALDDVDLERHRVDLDAEPRRGLVDEVDRLVGELTTTDVAVGEHRGGDQRGVLDADTVVDLVALLQAAQDRDRVFHRRLADVHLLEAAFERGVLFDVLAVLVECRRTDEPQLPARQHRLDHVAGVDRAFGATGADERVDLVDEGDDLAFGVGDLLQRRLEALFEFAAVLRARNH